MKKIFTLGSVVILMAQLVACSKKDTNTANPNQNNTTDTTQIDAAVLKNQWQGIGAYNLYYNASNALVDADGASKTYNGFSTWWVDSFAAKMIFNADNTFDQARFNGSSGVDIFTSLLPAHGRWQLADNNHTLLLEFMGAQSDTLLPFKVISFNDHYLHVAYTDNSDTLKDVFHLEFTR